MIVKLITAVRFRTSSSDGERTMPVVADFEWEHARTYGAHTMCRVPYWIKVDGVRVDDVVWHDFDGVDVVA